MKEQPGISRELFIESINALQSQYDHDCLCSSAFRTILPCDHISCYDNHWVNNQLVKLLQVALNDEHAHSWIEYYCFELSFGRSSFDAKATRADGSPIDLSGPGPLYDFLLSTLSDNLKK